MADVLAFPAARIVGAGESARAAVPSKELTNIVDLRCVRLERAYVTLIGELGPVHKPEGPPS